MQSAAPHLDRAFLALADPTRRAILARLADGEASALELAEPFPISQPAISRHLKVLENAGLIERRSEGTKRYCNLAANGLDELDEYLELLRRSLENNYTRLDALLSRGIKSKRKT